MELLNKLLRQQATAQQILADNPEDFYAPQVIRQTADTIALILS